MQPDLLYLISQIDAYAKEAENQATRYKSLGNTDLVAVAFAEVWTEQTKAFSHLAGITKEILVGMIGVEAGVKLLEEPTTREELCA